MSASCSLSDAQCIDGCPVELVLVIVLGLASVERPVRNGEECQTEDTTSVHNHCLAPGRGLLDGGAVEKGSHIVDKIQGLGDVSKPE